MSGPQGSCWPYLPGPGKVSSQVLGPEGAFVPAGPGSARLPGEGDDSGQQRGQFLSSLLQNPIPPLCGNQLPGSGAVSQGTRPHSAPGPQPLFWPSWPVTPPPPSLHQLPDGWARGSALITPFHCSTVSYGCLLPGKKVQIFKRCSQGLPW